MSIYKDPRIEIYGKKKQVETLNGLLTKVRLQSKWFNKVIRHITKDQPLKIFLINGVGYKNSLYGKATHANIVFIFIDEMTEHMYDWRLELLLCVTIHEIMHLTQNRDAYYQTWKYAPYAEKRMEQDADMQTHRVLEEIKEEMDEFAALKLCKFMSAIAPNILDIREGETVKFDIDLVPITYTYINRILTAILDEVDENELNKMSIHINGKELLLFNEPKNIYNWRAIEFFFYYSELYKIKHNREGRIRDKKSHYVLEYDKEIYTNGVELIRSLITKLSN